MTMPKLFRVVGALINQDAANKEVEPVSATPSYEGRMIFSLSICLVVSIILVAIADDIERRSAARGDRMDSLDAGVPPSSMSSIGDVHAAKSHPNVISPVAASKNSNDEQSTLQELDDLVDDIVKSSTRMKEEDSKSTRQFDEIMKYDQFLKLIKS